MGSHSVPSWPRSSALNGGRGISFTKWRCWDHLSLLPRTHSCCWKPECCSLQQNPVLCEINLLMSRAKSLPLKQVGCPQAGLSHGHSTELQCRSLCQCQPPPASSHRSRARQSKQQRSQRVTNRNQVHGSANSSLCARAIG